MEHGRALGRFSFDTVLDVGANKGQFAVFARRQWPKAKIHCFEPLPRPRATLERLVTPPGEVHACALGTVDGEATLHVASRDDSSSLLPLGEAQRSFYRTHEVDAVTVTTRRLDTLFSGDDVEGALLKIDVQGFEYEVLQGAATLLRRLLAVYVECSFVELYQGQHLAQDVIELVRGKGFRLVGRFNEDLRSGEPVQADLLFLQGTERTGSL